MTRTDIHRPSAPEFDPEAYDFFGCFDLHPEWGSDGRQEVVSHLVSQGWSFAGAPHGSGQCSHCGARLRYVALMGHTATHTLMYIGETCLDNRFSMTKGEFAELRKQGALNAERTAKRERIANLLAEHPVLVWASYAYNIATTGGQPVWFVRDDYEGTEYATEEEARATLPESQRDDFWAVGYGYKRGTTWEERARQYKSISTLNDIWHKVERYAEVSDAQVAYVERLVGWLTEADEKLAEREAAQAALVASGVHVPTGRVVVEGTVLSTKQVEQQAGPYGTTMVTKMLVQADEGWKVWGTVPSAIYDVDKGARVRFTATVTASDDDPTFGFAKRPAKAEVL